jgi:plasmid stabilization system protein ParE
MHVVLSVAAEADLQEIGDWIALDNPVRAASFVRELREACLTLADMPRAFPVVRRRRAVQIRRKPYRSYLSSIASAGRRSKSFTSSTARGITTGCCLRSSYSAAAFAASGMRER